MRHVALTFGDRCLRLVRDGHRWRLRALGSDVDPSAVFTRVPLTHDRVALRCAQGFLTRLPDAGENFGLYPCPDLTPQAALEEILWPDGRVSLRCQDLTYVGVDDAGVVTANRVEPGAHARFAYVDVLPTVPGQRQGRERKEADLRSGTASVPAQGGSARAPRRGAGLGTGRDTPASMSAPAATRGDAGS